MSSKQFKIYIPRAETHHTEAYIRTAFNNVADIESIEFIARENLAGQKYNGAIITIREWCEPQYNTTFQALNAGREHKYHHCRKYFWVLTKHVVKVAETSEPTEEEQEQINQNIHVYIVRAENYHNEEYIRTAFRDIAIISQMTFVPKKNEKGQTYNGVVLLIRKWINKTNGMLETLSESKEYRHQHTSKYHWLMTRHRIEGPPEESESKCEATENVVVEPVEFIVGETYKITIDREYLEKHSNWSRLHLSEIEYIGTLETLPSVAKPRGYGECTILKTINNTNDLLDLPKLDGEFYGECILKLDVNTEEKIFVLDETKNGRNGYVIGIEKVTV